MPQSNDINAAVIDELQKQIEDLRQIVWNQAKASKDLGDVMLQIGEHVLGLQKELQEVRDASASLQKGLVQAFREMGYDFSKIGQIESSRPLDLTPSFQTTKKIHAKNEPRQDGDVCPI